MKRELHSRAEIQTVAGEVGKRAGWEHHTQRSGEEAQLCSREEERLRKEDCLET